MEHVTEPCSIPYVKGSQIYIETTYDLISIKGDHILVTFGVKYHTSVHCPKRVQLSWDNVRILPGSRFEPRTLRIHLGWDLNYGPAYLSI